MGPRKLIPDNPLAEATFLFPRFGFYILDFCLLQNPEWTNENPRNHFIQVLLCKCLPPEGCVPVSNEKQVFETTLMFSRFAFERPFASSTLQGFDSMGHTGPL